MGFLFKSDPGGPAPNRIRLGNVIFPATQVADIGYNLVVASSNIDGTVNMEFSDRNEMRDIWLFILNIKEDTVYNGLSQEKTYWQWEEHSVRPCGYCWYDLRKSCSLQRHISKVLLFLTATLLLKL